MCAQCDFSKHSDIFTLGNSHPPHCNPIVTLEINDGGPQVEMESNTKPQKGMCMSNVLAFLSMPGGTY